MFELGIKDIPASFLIFQVSVFMQKYIHMFSDAHIGACELVKSGGLKQCVAEDMPLSST